MPERKVWFVIHRGRIGAGYFSHATSTFWEDTASLTADVGSGKLLPPISFFSDKNQGKKTFYRKTKIGRSPFEINEGLIWTRSFMDVARNWHKSKIRLSSNITCANPAIFISAFYSEPHHPHWNFNKFSHDSNSSASAKWSLMIILTRLWNERDGSSSNRWFSRITFLRISIANNFNISIINYFNVFIANNFNISITNYFNISITNYFNGDDRFCPCWLLCCCS